MCTCVSVAIVRGVPAFAADLIWLLQLLLSLLLTWTSFPAVFLCIQQVRPCTAYTLFTFRWARDLRSIILFPLWLVSPIALRRRLRGRRIIFLFHFQIIRIVMSALGLPMTSLEVVQWALLLNTTSPSGAPPLWCSPICRHLKPSH